MVMVFPGHVPLAVATRGSAAENLYNGSLAVVDAQGRLLAAAGDPQALVFARSTIKPLQALPFVGAGGLAHFGWGVDETALLCASHSGEAAHLAVVGRMLDGCGVSSAALGCGAHVPISYATLSTLPPADACWTALHNNCSGKHTGFLAYCRWRGWSLDDYLDFAHPLQAEIRQAISEFADIDAATLPWGIDGCSAPNYALPLSALAYAYARLAAGAPGTPFGGAATGLRDAMRERPQLISGVGRADLQLAQAGCGDWIAKVGADGVQTLASISRGIGIAIKIGDGNAQALLAVTVELLRQLGWLDDAAAQALASLDHPPIRNWRGTQTGRLEPRVLLERC